MAKLNNRILLGFAVLMISFINVEGQKGVEDGSRYGHGKDSIRCLRNLSLYTEYARQHNYAMAYPFWKIVFDECPLATKNIYIDGARMLHEKIESTTDDALESNLLDTLMLVYDRRIKYFGQKGDVRGRQGVDLLKYKRNADTSSIKQAYNYLDESINLQKMQTPEAVLATYVSASLILYQNKVFTAEKTIKDYLRVSGIVDQDIKTRPNDKNLQLLKSSINENFVKQGPSKCEDLVSFFSKEIDTRTNDAGFLRMLTTLMRNSECTEDPLFYKASKALQQVEPTAESALNIALLAYNSGKYDDAIDYYKQALKLETDENKKADYYYGLALTYSRKGDKEMSRDYARKAIEARPNWGDPYLLIGQLYADSKNDCSSISLPNAVFWAAVDEFNKAKSVDPSVVEKANKLILTYSAYYPNKEEAFFQNIIEGNTYKIGCWINETTKARFNK